MQRIQLENFSSTFFYGAYSVIRPSKWKDQNVFISMAKLYYVVKGRIFIKTDDKTIQVDQGEMILIPPNFKHDYYTDHVAEKYWFHFAITNSNVDFFSEWKFADKITVVDKQTVTDLFETVLYMKNKRTLESKVKVHSAILQLLAYYIEKGGYTKIEQVNNKIEDIKQFIEDNQNTDLKLSRIAKQFGYSDTYIIKKFKTTVGVSPIQYKNKIKIEKAKNLLETTDLYVTEAMEKVGFKDNAYFSKLFRKYTGFSPRAYKELYKKNKH